MALDDADLGAAELLLSPARLATLLTLTGSPRAAIELHQETLALNAALMNVVAIIEIGLRNSVCENLARHFGTATWLTHPPAPFQWRKIENGLVAAALKSARRAKYAKMSQAEKAALDALAFPAGRPPNLSHAQRAAKRRDQIAVTEGSVVAELTFYFWKKLFGGDYEQALWRTTLKRIFPNKRLKRAQIAENLEAIYQTRNRLAHHEPVLHKRYNDAIRALTWVVENLGQVTPSTDTPLAKMIADEMVIVTAKAATLHARLDSFRGP